MTAKLSRVQSRLVPKPAIPTILVAIHMNTSRNLDYGLSSCLDLHNKLTCEGVTLENNWNIYNCFNFILTAWHLHEDWIDKDRTNRPLLSTKKKGQHGTPKRMMQIIWALRDITNSSKHFGLDKKANGKKVTTGIHKPLIGDAASYFLHGPMIYIEIEDSIYSMWDIRYIVLLYFDWIFNDSIPVIQFPQEIQDHIDRCIIK